MSSIIFFCQGWYGTDYKNSSNCSKSKARLGNLGHDKLFSSFSNLGAVKLSKDWVIISERADFANLVLDTFRFSKLHREYYEDTLLVHLFSFGLS